MASLEVIARLPPPDVAPRGPLLFVHGGFHSAASWDGHFLPFFAAHGFAAHALSLRGHGGSGGPERLRGARLADYVADLREVLAELPGAALIGHSMGARVVQLHLETATAPLAVLFAPSPLESVWGVTLRLMTRHPGAFLRAAVTRDLRAALPAFESFFYGPGLDRSTLARYRGGLGGESLDAVLDTFGRTPHDPTRVRAPVVVVAAADDTSIPLAVNQRLAARYHAPCIVVPGAHCAMLEPHWREAAEVLLELFGERGL